jgi:hypothetical protein
MEACRDMQGQEMTAFLLTLILAVWWWWWVSAATRGTHQHHIQHTGTCILPTYVRTYLHAFLRTYPTNPPTKQCPVCLSAVLPLSVPH